MAKKIKIEFKLNEILFPIVMLLAGLCLIFFSSNLLNIALFVIGGMFVIAGIATLIKKEYIAALINFTVGIVIILLGALIIQFAVLIIGVLLFVSGTLSLIKQIVEKKNDLLCYVSPIIMILVGVLLVFGNFYQFIDFILSAAGLCLVIYAVYKIIFTLFQKKSN